MVRVSLDRDDDDFEQQQASFDPTNTGFNPKPQLIDILSNSKTPLKISSGVFFVLNECKWLCSGGCAVGGLGMTYGDPMTYGDTGRGTKSMFGEQVRSTSRSAPSFGFGTSSRHGPSRTSASPGPSAYTVPRGVGTQPDSRKISSSQYGFGSNGRFKDKAKMGPGAPAYVRTDKRERRSHPSACKWLTIMCAGPAAYDMPPGVGRQVDSGKTNQPRFGFGTENSSNQRPAHGVESPGPIYSLNAAVGSQQLSQRGTQPSWNFTTEHRFKSDQQRRTTSPGPGATPAPSPAP